MIFLPQSPSTKIMDYHPWLEEFFQERVFSGAFNRPAKLLVFWGEGIVFIYQSSWSRFEEYSSEYSWLSVPTASMYVNWKWICVWRGRGVCSVCFEMQSYSSWPLTWRFSCLSYFSSWADRPVLCSNNCFHNILFGVLRSSKDGLTYTRGCTQAICK